MLYRASHVLAPAGATLLLGSAILSWPLAPAPARVAAPAAVLAPAVVAPARAAAAPAAPAPAVAQPAPTPRTPRIVATDARIADRLNQLRPCVKKRLARVVQRLPEKVTLLVTSAYRTHEEQASLKSTFGVKAKPGTSTHEDGRAVDVNVLVGGVRVPPRRQQKIIGAAMASEGFKHLGPRDPVHYSIPKDEIDPYPTEDPILSVVTVEELEAIQQAPIVY